MNETTLEADLLVVDMHYTLYGPNGLFVNLLDIELAAADSDSTIYKIIHLQPVCDDYEMAVGIETDILNFINENFPEGTTPVLIAHSMHDLLRYFEQSAPRLAARLQNTIRIDVDTLIGMVPPSTPLYMKTLRKPELLPNASHTLEVYLRFKEVYW